MPPRVFISSLATEHKDLRLKIHNNFGDQVWVAEHTRPDLSQRRLTDLEIVDACADAIQQADYVVCIFADRRGSAIEVGGHLANATHFETEIFQAAVLKKDIRVLTTKNFTPDPALKELLNILRGNNAITKWSEELSDDDILKTIEKLVGNPGRHRFRKIITRFQEGFFDARGTPHKGGEILTTFFAGNHLVNPAVSPDLNIVKKIVHSLSEQENQHKKLSRVYIALREILARPLEEESLLAFRNELLGHWVSAASWYGLHGHIRSGALAAALSMAEVRAHMKAKHLHFDNAQVLAYPGGSIASALYSIARQVAGSRRTTLLQQAHQHIAHALNDPANKPENLIAIRGSVNRLRGALDEAVTDYKTVLHFRKINDAGFEKIGDAQSELGFGLIRQWQIPKGRDHILHGVQLMRKARPSGFLVRGLKKLAIAHLITGHPLKALDAFNEAKRVAHEAKMFDQVG
ncbi:MAG: hypothetical protein AAF564_25645 [Bacteroidota bacterium]